MQALDLDKFVMFPNKKDHKQQPDYVGCVNIDKNIYKIGCYVNEDDDEEFITGSVYLDIIIDESQNKGTPKLKQKNSKDYDKLWEQMISGIKKSHNERTRYYFMLLLNKKTRASQPDFVGSITINDIVHRMVAWVKTDKNQDQFLSGSIDNPVDESDIDNTDVPKLKTDG